MQAEMKLLSSSFILAGVIVTIIGFYFSFFMAGLPYQDPTTVMTIRWMAYYEAGNICFKTGIIVGILGFIFKLFYKYLDRSKSISPTIHNLDKD